MRQRKHNDWFQFKQFRVEQAHSGMRVTTHACLFGARVPVAGARRILDIGAGTGLLSLMLAQRSQAQIDAVELDAGACQDAARNFAASPWSQRLHLHAGAIQQFAPPEGDGYDCIVSNPPFFSASWRAEDSARNLARHDDSLSLQSLLQLACMWLRDDGQLWLLLPVEADQRLHQAAAMATLELRQQIDIRAKPDKPVARRIVALAKSGRSDPPPALRTASAEPAATPALARHELCIHDPYPAYSREALQLLRPYYSSL